jgi:hypothetical protein
MVSSKDASFVLSKASRDVEMKDFYTMKNVFFLEDISRWSCIIKNAKQNDIALHI